MPFVEYMPCEKKENKPSSKENTIFCPIFIIPGILGNQSELSYLAHALYTIHQQPIYLYQHPLLNSESEFDSNNNDNITLTIQASEIVNEIHQKVPRGSVPYTIIGYSYGSGLAAETSQILKNDGNDPILFLIDAPSPATYKKYYQTQSTNGISPSLRSDVLKILNYAALLAGLTPVEEKHAFTTSCIFNNLRELIESITIKIFDHNSDEEEYFDLFNKYKFIFTQNLYCLMNYQSNSPANLDKAFLFLTDKTKAKYALTNNGDWSSYATNITALEDRELAQQEHTNLLKQANAEKIAILLSRSMKQELTRERCFLNAVKYALKLTQSNTLLQNSQTQEIINLLSALTTSNHPKKNILSLFQNNDQKNKIMNRTSSLNQLKVLS